MAARLRALGVVVRPAHRDVAREEHLIGLHLALGGRQPPGLAALDVHDPRVLVDLAAAPGAGAGKADEISRRVALRLTGAAYGAADGEGPRRAVDAVRAQAEGERRLGVAA